MVMLVYASVGKLSLTDKTHVNNEHMNGHTIDGGRYRGAQRDSFEILRLSM